MIADGAEAALEQWFRANGGYLHEAVRIAYTDHEGLHFRAKSDIPGDTVLSITPHTIALSYLNALVDDQYTFFKQHRHEFGGVENIGFFYLMIQLVHRETSFWRPYIDALPSPSSKFNSPLWFDDEATQRLIANTDVWFTNDARTKVYVDYHGRGLSILKSAGLDTTPYTWDLFRWAVTMFTSRAFSSRSVTPQDSKYWTAYKTRPDGRRQTVLLDMSHTPSADLDFPVLFPVQDVPNHQPHARVEWTYDPGRFIIKTLDATAAGAEVLNNYGPKGNDELLLGYGFCIIDNPQDAVSLTLKPPPDSLQPLIRQALPGYFKPPSEGDGWDGVKATFALKAPVATGPWTDADFLGHFPEPMLELLTYVTRHERELPFEILEAPRSYLSGMQGSRYLSHLATVALQSLLVKRASLQAVPRSQMTDGPAMEGTHYATIYRDSQLRICSALCSQLSSYMASFNSPSDRNGIGYYNVESLASMWQARSPTGASTLDQFWQGIELNAGTRDIQQLRAAGWEDDVLVLMLCAAVLDNGEWLVDALPEYTTRSVDEKGLPCMPHAAEKGLLPQAQSILELVGAADEALGEDGLIWRSPEWNAEFVAAVGSILVYDSREVPVGEGDEVEVRNMVYLHLQS